MKKCYLYLTTDEWRIVIQSLNDHRNKLITEGRHIDFVDEVLFKAMTAHTKKIRVV